MFHRHMRLVLVYDCTEYVGPVPVSGHISPSRCPVPVGVWRSLRSFLSSRRYGFVSLAGVGLPGAVSPCCTGATGLPAFCVSTCDRQEGAVVELGAWLQIGAFHNDRRSFVAGHVDSIARHAGVAQGVYLWITAFSRVLDLVGRNVYRPRVSPPTWRSVMPAKRAPSKPTPPKPTPIDRAGRNRMQSFAAQRRTNEGRMRGIQRDPGSASGTAGRNTLNKMVSYRGIDGSQMGAGSSEQDMARRAGGMARAAAKPKPKRKPMPGPGKRGGSTVSSLRGPARSNGSGTGRGGKGTGMPGNARPAKPMRSAKKAATNNGRMR